MASPTKNQIVEDEEEAIFSLQSIRMEESLLEVTPSPASPEVYDIYNISSPHISGPKEDIQISICEEKHSFHSLQKFSSNSLNFVHSLPVTVSEMVEEFDFSI